KVDACVAASLTKAPIDGSGGRTCGSVNGIDVMVFGTPFLRSPLLTDCPSAVGRSSMGMLPRAVGGDEMDYPPGATRNRNASRESRVGKIRVSSTGACIEGRARPA